MKTYLKTSNGPFLLVTVFVYFSLLFFASLGIPLVGFFPLLLVGGFGLLIINQIQHKFTRPTIAFLLSSRVTKNQIFEDTLKYLLFHHGIASAILILTSYASIFNQIGLFQFDLYQFFTTSIIILLSAVLSSITHTRYSLVKKDAKKIQYLLPYALLIGCILIAYFRVFFILAVIVTAISFYFFYKQSIDAFENFDIS